MKNKQQDTLRLTEMFFSIQGESSRMGEPCIFIRTTACNLRCTWCDTTYSFFGGETWTIDAIMEHIGKWPCKLVEITGGEPLLQKHLNRLIEALFAADYQVMIETGGHMDIGVINERVKRIVDIKCPGSGESEKIYWENLAKITPHDEVKFVIKDRDDYDFSVDVVKKYQLEKRCTVLFSPVFGVMDAKVLANWLLEDGLDVRYQLQLHKFIWDPEKKGV